MVSKNISGRNVYVVGAGFSAGLNFPLVHDLLVRLWQRLPSEDKNQLQKVISFHHPGFNPKRNTSFPTIEHLLSEMMVNEHLFNASRRKEGKFKFKNLVSIRQQLLLEVAQWFHEIHEDIFNNTPNWLSSFVEMIKSENAIVISFNWDLVLDQLLFGEEITQKCYGLDQNNIVFPYLLKPHGSLNWFHGPTAKLLRQDRRILIHSDDTSKRQEVYAFKLYRSPQSSKRKYMPLIIPPIFGKTFDFPVFRDIWRGTVSALSQAKTVTFLGYSLPEADLHAKFILRCGFHNQLDGEITGLSARGPRPGAAKIVAINPDAGSARRIEAAVGKPIDWTPTTVANWVEKINCS